MSLSLLTDPVSPDIDLDLSPLVSRPPPFLGPSDGPLSHGKTSGNTGSSSSNAYGAATHTFLPLNRKARNAKTVDFFR